MRVKQFYAKNQFVIADGSITIFQSHDSDIVRQRVNPETKDYITELDRNNWDYSKTTGKYRNIFLSETKKETERKIKEGIYTLTDLN